MKYNYLFLFLLSFTALYGTKAIEDAPEQSAPRPTWTINNQQTQGIGSYEELKKALYPEDILFKLEELKGDPQIPSRPYDLSNMAPSDFPERHLREAWNDAYRDNRLFVAHGFSGHRNQRILDYYFQQIYGKKAADLTAAEVLNLAPFLALGLRNIVSGCLFDMEASKDRLCHYYNIGFLFKIPSQNIFKIRGGDAMTATEGVHTPQAIRDSIEKLKGGPYYSYEDLKKILTPEQRKEYRQYRDEKEETEKYDDIKPVTEYFAELFPNAKGPHANKFKYDWADLTPKMVLKETVTYNEIAFVPRVSNPDLQAVIVGIYFHSSMTGFGYGVPGKDTPLKDPLGREQTLNILQTLAIKMNVPLLEFK